MQSRRRSFAFFSIFVVAAIAAQIGSAQGVAACQTTNTLVIGTYGFVLNSGTFFQGVITNPPGTTGATTFEALAANPPGTSGSVTYSNTQVGRLLGGLAGVSVGSVSGVLYFDGNGSVFASSTVGGAPSTLVGTYTVNSDCTITVSLNDAFSTMPHPPSVSFTGFLANGGTEINLVPAAQIPAASTVPPTALLQLIRINAQTTCSASTLTGPYSLVGEGLTSANARAALLARIKFDGNGKVIDDTVLGVNTPLVLFQYTGTYIVNPDCTGTITLSQKITASPAAQPATTPPVILAFVITYPIVQVNSTGGVAFQSPFALRPSILFSLVNQSVIVSGIGKAQ